MNERSGPFISFFPPGVNPSEEITCDKIFNTAAQSFYFPKIQTFHWQNTCFGSVRFYFPTWTNSPGKIKGSSSRNGVWGKLFGTHRADVKQGLSTSGGFVLIFIRIVCFFYQIKLPLYLSTPTHYWVYMEQHLKYKSQNALTNYARDVSTSGLPYYKEIKK